MRKALLGLAASFAFIIIVWAPSSAQDFSKTYPVTAGGSVKVSNVSGDINVTGTDGNAVVVQAIKEGPDRDKVEVEDLSGDNSIELRVKYPKCNWSEDRQNCNVNASVRFEVQIPRSIALDYTKFNTASGDIKVNQVQANITVSTASGEVTVSNSHGNIHANSASGDVLVKNVAGQVKANTASGNVEVEIAKLEGSDDMAFNSASGDVRVRMPSDLDAEVSMSTVSGKIKTDFPLEVKEHKYGPGSSASGRLGNGTRRVRLATASGDLSLTRM